MQSASQSHQPPDRYQTHDDDVQPSQQLLAPGTRMLNDALDHRWSTLSRDKYRCLAAVAALVL